MLAGSILDDMYSLQIGVPASSSLIIGMADIISVNRAFTTNLAFLGHKFYLL